MLLDWLEQLLSSCPRHLREMGYLRELLGIRRRFRRWRSAWQPHCDRSCALIRSAVRRCARRRKAVVFGSGWLHDVPTDELAAAFAEVVLVDLLHPLQTRWRVRRRKNVRLLAADVSGVAEAVWLAVERPGSPLPHARPNLFVGDDEVDLIVSLNLLSQLPVMPEQYLRRWGRHGPDEVLTFCRDVVRAHLDYLPRLPGVVAVIADVEVSEVDLGGAVASRKPTLYGVEFPWSGEQWVWQLVPRRDRYPYHGEHLTVVGVTDVKAAETRPARNADG